jgi:hypothetical protein
MSLHLPFRQIHLDFHTGPAIPDVGSKWDADLFGDTLKEARVNSITLFAKCHHGHLYYDTKRAERHPGLTPGLDLLGEQLQAMFISYGAGVSHFKAGKLRVLAATTTTRSSALPDVPTISEAGVKGYDSSVWYALMAPRRTPAEVISKLNADCVALIKAEVGAQLTADGITPVGSTPEALAAYIRSESTKWAQVVKRSGATLD